MLRDKLRHSNIHIFILEIMTEMIRSVEPVSKWKLLVADVKGLRILDSTFKSFEILEENVTGKSLSLKAAIENLTKKRQAFPSIEAIYFISPTEETLNRVIDDFSGARPQYAAAHIFFISSTF
jgi:syntaxin-binding protein 1